MEKFDGLKRNVVIFRIHTLCSFNQITKLQTYSLKLLVKHTSGKTLTSIVDIGCGTGLVAEEIRKHEIQADITGLDLSNESLDRWHEDMACFKNNIHFHTACHHLNFWQKQRNLRQCALFPIIKISDN